MEQRMSRKFNVKLVALCIVLSAMLVVPALGQGKEEAGVNYKGQVTKILKGLKLAPEKEKALLAVEDKYTKERKEIFTAVKKAHAELQAAAAAANPDEAKLKELVSALTTNQDKMFGLFKNQRDEELALMTPLEQAKYLIALGQWRQKMKDKRGQKAAGDKK
jgi:Spy/CpxP family protein refolding chaperone